jgi:predicted nucleic acid-binding protein
VRLVLDASAAVNALVPGLLRESTWRHLEGAELVAPALVDTEVLSALARLERSGELRTAEADDAVDAWLQLPLDRVPGDVVAREVWSLRGSVRVADAHYVALARLLGAPLLTADARLARTPLAGVTLVVVQ